MLLFFLLRKRRTASTGSPTVVPHSFLAISVDTRALARYRRCFAVGLVVVLVVVCMVAVDDTDAVESAVKGAVACAEHANTGAVAVRHADAVVSVVAVEAGQAHVTAG